MRLTDAQMAERRNRITASLAPAILGCCDFTTAREAYFEIIGEPLPRAQLGNPDAPDFGHRFERVVAECWRRAQIGPEWEIEAVRDTLWHPEHTWLGATIDYLAHDPLTGERRILEIKTSAYRPVWGDDDTDQVPEKVRVQMAVQRLVHDSYEDGSIHGDPAHAAVVFTDGEGVTAMLGTLLAQAMQPYEGAGYAEDFTADAMAQWLLERIPGRFRHYTLPRDRDHEQHVLERLRRFKVEHLDPRIPPPAPDAGTFIEPDDRQAILLRRMAEINRDRDALKTEGERIKAALMAECRGYGGFQLGECRVPWVTQKAGEVRYMREAGEYLQFRSLGKLLKADADEQPIW